MWCFSKKQQEPEVRKNEFLPASLPCFLHRGAHIAREAASARAVAFPIKHGTLSRALPEKQRERARTCAGAGRGSPKKRDLNIS